MKALVLCAGFGRRLGPLTRRCPKPLLEVGSLTIVEHIALHLARCGVSDVWVNLHYHAEQFPEVLGNGAHLGVRIHYLHEETLRGTAGTARDLRPRLDGESLIVHYGDVITDHDLASLAALHHERRARATALLHRRHGSNSRAWLGPSDRIVRFEERPRFPLASAITDPWVFSGVCVLSPEVLGEFPPGHPLDLPRDVFPKLATRGGLFGQRLQGYRCAVDSPQRLESARLALNERTYHAPAPRTAA